MIPELTTDRLILRGWTLADIEPMATLYADESLSRYIGGPGDAGHAWRMVAEEAGHWVLRGYGIWALEKKGTGETAGWAGMWHPGDWPELEIGWALFPGFHGHGYATEAARCARAYAYSELGATTLVSYIHPDNEPSKRVARRLGARYEQTIELNNHPAEVFRHPGPDETGGNSTDQRVVERS